MSGARNTLKRMKKIFKDYGNRIIPTLIDYWKMNPNKKKQMWTKTWILRRGIHGASVGLFRKLESEDPTEYRMFMRMNTEHQCS